MQTKVKLNYLRIAPRKVRLVADLIRKKSVREAENILKFTIKKASPVLLKLLKSAVASAKQRFQVTEDDLYISHLTVDEGPKLKRWMPRARGQAYPIYKRTSHVTLVVESSKSAPLSKAESKNREGVNKKGPSKKTILKTNRNRKRLIEESDKQPKVLGRTKKMLQRKVI